MARRQYAGAASATTLAGAITASTTTIQVASGGGSGFPDGSTASFIIAIDRGTASEEKVLCLSRSGDVFTVAAVGDRGYDDTSATSHADGASVEHVLGAIDLDEPNEHINNAALDHHTQYLNTSRHTATSHTTAMIADGAVTTAKLGADAVDSTKLADNAVGAEHIQTGAVTADELGGSAVTEDKINAGAVTATKIGADAVDGSKIADNSIDTEHIAGQAVGANELASNAKVPSGMIGFWPSTTSAPHSSWLLCNGQAVSRTSYANLFTAIGTQFGVGDGSSTFNLPDMRLGFVRGANQTTVLAGSVDTFAAVGSSYSFMAMDVYIKS